VVFTNYWLNMTDYPNAQEKAKLILMPSGRRGQVQVGTSVLEAARELGVGIESICAGRLTCGKCKVKIEQGSFAKHGIVSMDENLSPATKEELDLINRLEIQGYRLSCSAHIQGDVLVSIPEESRAQKQIIRKTATERAIEVAPAVRQVYVEVDKPALGEHRGDWGRLQDALSEQWDLHNLSIDLIALRDLQEVLRKESWKVTVTLWQDSEVIDLRPGYDEGIYGLAVDIGSTTVASYLCDLRTGELLATESMMNPQVSYGEDLMSRVSYAMEHKNGLHKMHKDIIAALNKLAARTTRSIEKRSRDIFDVVVAGNTTMMHIFLGINPVQLGASPFALANRDSMDIKGRDLGLRFHRGAYVHAMPSEAGHVGADNIAVLIAEEPYLEEDITLVVDVGTNAEIVLGNRSWMYSASSPTGPALEGGQISSGMRAAPGAIERVKIDAKSKIPRFKVIGEQAWSDEWNLGPDVPVEQQPRHLATGICGSGIIDAIAEMYLTGILTPDGRFNPSSECDRLHWDGRKGAFMLTTPEETTQNKPIYITQEDVRNVQLAKGALYAGAKLLMKKADVHQVERIILAGAFGSYIDPKNAMILGLIPDCDLDQVYSVGNAAGDGARIALLNRHKRGQARDISRWVRYIETAVDPDFQAEFAAAMHMPHQHDSFPHLEGILPQETVPPPPARKRRFRRRMR
jgi:uncharacterized 2Fe-2S/4Fe-4S cluster protein (DUF4445 family)